MQPKKPNREKKIISSFSITPSFKRNLEKMFADLGVAWSAGVRMALKEFVRAHRNR